MKKNPHKDEKLPSMKMKIDRNYKTECWPKSIMGIINWLPLFYIMEFNVDRIDNDKYL